MSIEDLFQMKIEPGVVVVGKGNVDVEEVFDEICRKLHEFYEERGSLFDKRGLSFVSRKFRRRQTRYYCPVYVAEVPDIEFQYKRDRDGNIRREVVRQEQPVQYGTIKIEHIRQEEGIKFCGLALGNWNYTQQVFAVYFNLPDKGKAITEREAFFNYAKQKLN